MIRLTTILSALAVLTGNAFAQDEAPDLFALISDRDMAGLEAAIEAGADVNQRQSEGLEATPLMWSTGREANYTRVLLEAGAEVDVRDAMGDPAINWAAYYGNTDAIALLLAAGADTDLIGHGTPVEIVMRRGHEASFALLLDHRGERPDRSAAEAALEAAALAGDGESIAVLAPYVDMATARDWAGRPVLHAAARANRADAVTALIAAGAPVDGEDSIGFTALFEASRDGALDAVEALIAAGADVNHVSNENALSLTALHLAAIGNHVDVVGALLGSGADTDAVGTMGATPLMWAAFEGSHEAALRLVEAGTDLSVEGRFGDTALSAAEAYEWDDVVRAIRERLPE
ncbi:MULTISPECIES: ankyrin repeat domain-containing protein [Hyphobacterium]|uniref:Ankyrin repeat domain-containing protein n=1 Tax=Hyphobacterium vulgare TaxID=1736751 RepID=A0ABV6ZY71_9PROT